MRITCMRVSMQKRDTIHAHICFTTTTHPCSVGGYGYIERLCKRGLQRLNTSTLHGHDDECDIRDKRCDE